MNKTDWWNTEDNCLRVILFSFLKTLYYCFMNIYQNMVFCFFFTLHAYIEIYFWNFFVKKIRKVLKVLNFHYELLFFHGVGFEGCERVSFILICLGWDWRCFRPFNLVWMFQFWTFRNENFSWRWWNQTKSYFNVIFILLFLKPCIVLRVHSFKLFPR